MRDRILSAANVSTSSGCGMYAAVIAQGNAIEIAGPLLVRSRELAPLLVRRLVQTLTYDPCLVVCLYLYFSLPEDTRCRRI